MANILRNDQVIVIAGKNKGKTGRVLRVIADKNRVLVEGVAMIKKHVKPNPQANIKGGIAEQEAPIHISNVALMDSNGKATRVGIRTVDGKRERFAKSTGETLALPKRK
ncbi:50S ribosomal protein L24 [Terriglobus aquaticus]|uniref:Large ribosomal subunit protein uL24 n=1 Tax=Terriglobus aquaticus TaxID=940139 RepID=A0ABW9KLQ5_9BACT|nr:50S ribosomal protein L24 [Terriglobus aquaticus]